MLRNPCWSGREARPVVAETGVVEAEHNWHLHHLDQPDLTPEVRLSIRPDNRACLDLRSKCSDALIKHSACVQHQVENGEATPEIEGSAGYDPAGTRDSSHLGGKQFDICEDIDDEGRDAGVK